ncbi:MAG: SurA N-terminal domain-containing protein [Bacillaceae bacterium]|nr:SurA N-terminal domain-containing protein [Bacillaceae bacterium]
MRKKWLLSLLLAGFVSVTAACGNTDESAENNTEAPEVQEEAAPVNGEQPDMPEPDLDGIPDVVASVNGKDISKEDFESVYVNQFMQAAMQAQMFGEEVNQSELKEQMIESMIAQELLKQEADKAGHEASEEDITNTLEDLAAQYGVGTSDEFLAALEEQGMEREEVMSELALQVKVDKLIASETGEIEPTEAELKEFYELAVAQQAQMGGEDVEIPPFEELKEEIEKQVKLQKQTEVAQALVGKLREEADVTINL